MTTLLVWVAVVSYYVALAGGQNVLPSVRPQPDNRTFTSASVDAFISEMAPKFRDANLSVLFSNCWPNTLDTTVAYHDDGKGNDTFIVTGDIPALWLRDSANQVLPYMSFAAQDAPLAAMLCGLVRRQARSVLLDAYANAFNYDASGAGHQDDVRTPPMTPPVYEGKYELDSLAAFLKLSRSYWNATEDRDCFAFADESEHLEKGTWFQAVERTLDVISWNTQGTAAETDAGWWYSFHRDTTVATDTLMQEGRGPPAADGTGLSKSYFRPSDDGQTLPFHVPANAMALVELLHVANLLEALDAGGGGGGSDEGGSAVETASRSRAAPPRRSDQETKAGEPKKLSAGRRLASRARALARGIQHGLRRFAVVANDRCGCDEGEAGERYGSVARIHGTTRSGCSPENGEAPSAFLAYEVDGFGSQYFMDDANIPSLLSLPYLGFLDPPATPTPLDSSATEEAGAPPFSWAPVVAATRAKVLSGASNPFFFSGSAGRGVGGPHVGYGFVWPMSIVMRALTSDDDDEISACLEAIVASSAGTGLLHESFNMNNATDFTRPWFAWVNGLFGELVLTLIDTRPWLVLKD